MTEMFKVLNADLTAYHGGADPAWEPGVWREVEGQLIPCENGLHLCTLTQLPEWLGPAVWVAEAEGEGVGREDKWVVRKARITEPTLWDEQRARLFACDCATRALHHAGETNPRFEASVTMARRYAYGEATRGDLEAARRAADAAAKGVAWDAATDTVKSATKMHPAWRAARTAARGAKAVARDAAGSSAEAGAGAWGAEGRWQAERLKLYLHDQKLPG